MGNINANKVRTTLAAACIAALALCVTPIEGTEGR